MQRSSSNGGEPLPFYTSAMCKMRIEATIVEHRSAPGTVRLNSFIHSSSPPV